MWRHEPRGFSLSNSDDFLAKNIVWPSRIPTAFVPEVTLLKQTAHLLGLEGDWPCGFPKSTHWQTVHIPKLTPTEYFTLRLEK